MYLWMYIINLNTIYSQQHQRHYLKSHRHITDTLITWRGLKRGGVHY